jgi:hypothetical protein
MTLESLDFQRSSEGQRTAEEDEMQCRREVRTLVIEQGEKQIGGTSRRNDILYLHSIVNGPLTLLRGGKSLQIQGFLNFSILPVSSSTHIITN